MSYYKKHNSEHLKGMCNFGDKDKHGEEIETWQERCQCFEDLLVIQKEELNKQINLLREALQVQLDSCSALGCGACNKARKAMELTRDEV